MFVWVLIFYNVVPHQAKIFHHQERWGMSIQGCLRADLVDLLAKPLLADGALRYSTTVTGVEQARADKWVMAMSKSSNDCLAKSNRPMVPIQHNLFPVGCTSGCRVARCSRRTWWWVPTGSTARWRPPSSQVRAMND